MSDNATPENENTDSGTSVEQEGNVLRGKSSFEQPAPAGSTNDDKPNVPEKFLDKDGKPDWNRFVESYQSLEKRIGTGDLPPGSAEEYQSEHDEFISDEEVHNAFRQEALDAGLTKSQYDFVMKKYTDLISTPEKAEAELKEAWGEEYEQNLQLAQEGINRLVPEDININHLGNDPAFIQLMSRLATEMKEDSAPPTYSQEGQGSTLSIIEAREMMNDPDYTWNKEKQELVRKAYEARFNK